MQAFSKVWDPFLNLITLKNMIALETVIHSPRKLRAALGDSTHQTDGNGAKRSDSKSGGANAIGELYGRK